MAITFKKIDKNCIIDINNFIPYYEALSKLYQESLPNSFGCTYCGTKNNGNIEDRTIECILLFELKKRTDLKDYRINISEPYKYNSTIYYSIMEV